MIEALLLFFSVGLIALLMQALNRASRDSASSSLGIFSYKAADQDPDSKPTAQGTDH